MTFGITFKIRLSAVYIIVPPDPNSQEGEILKTTPSPIFVVTDVNAFLP